MPVTGATRAQKPRPSPGRQVGAGSSAADEDLVVDAGVNEGLQLLMVTWVGDRLAGPSELAALFGGAPYGALVRSRRWGGGGAVTVGVRRAGDCLRWLIAGGAPLSPAALAAARLAGDAARAASELLCLEVGREGRMLTWGAVPTSETAALADALADASGCSRELAERWWRALCQSRLAEGGPLRRLEESFSRLAPAARTRVSNDAVGWGHRLANLQRGELGEVRVRPASEPCAPWLLDIALPVSGSSSAVSTQAEARAITQMCRAAKIPIKRRRLRAGEVLELPRPLGTSLDALIRGARENGVQLVMPSRLRSALSLRPQLVVAGEATGFAEPELCVVARCVVGPYALSAREVLGHLDDGVGKFGDVWVRLDPAACLLLEQAAELEERLCSVADLLGSAAFAREHVDLTAVGGRAAWLLRQESAPARPIPPLGVELRPWQSAALAWLAALEDAGVGGVLADDMGLGKTLSVLALAATGGTTLVLCPPNVEAAWRAEAARYVPGLRVGQIQEVGAAAGGPDVVVLPYSRLRASHERLARHHWTRLVLDEAHRLGSASASSARLARAIPHEHCHVLTGTPGHVRSLVRLLSYTCPELVGPGFVQRFPSLGGNGPAGEASRQRLRRVAGGLVLRRTKARTRALGDLEGPVTDQRVVELGAGERAAYDRLLDEALAALGGREGLARRSLLRGAITRLSDACVGDITGSTKLAALREIAMSIDTAGEAAVIFTLSVDAAISAATALRDAGLGAALAAESTASARRALQRFEAGEGPDMLVVTLAGAAVGINLVRASHVVHLQHGTDPLALRQANDRVWRLGQTRRVEIHHLLSAGSIDERLARWTASPGASDRQILERLASARSRDLPALLGRRS